MTTVLLVDDARLMAEFQSTALGRASFDLIPLRVGQDVARLAGEIQPDVILLRDGESCPDVLDACHALAARPDTRRIPLIYIGLGLHRERYLEAGVDVFIPRPVTRHQLQEAIRQVLPLEDRIALRRSVRFPVRLDVGETEIPGRCVNLSLTGAFVELDRRAEVGEGGRLRFQAAGREMVLPCEVVRQGKGAGLKHGVGLRFVNAGAETSAFLARFVRTEGERRGEPGVAAAGSLGG